jgi:hypothetical protein
MERRIVRLTAPEIEAFRNMLDASDGTPTVVATDSLWVGAVGMAERVRDQVLVHPNPTGDGWLTVMGRDGRAVEVLGAFDAQGRAIALQWEPHRGGLRVQLPPAAGVYFLHLQSGAQTFLERVVRAPQ